jgi:dTMP kinase
MADGAGYFISFEGGEGSGKTTQISLLAQWIEQVAPSRCPLVTREPGGTPVAEDIRALLVKGSADKLLPATEALLMSASRHEHVERVIKPALADGRIVISDRYNDSTRIYQGIVGGVGSDAIAALNRLACGTLVPDITFLLDMDVDSGLGRADGRGGDETRFESKGASFHKAVRRGFLDLAESEPQRFVVLDAAASITELANSVRSAVTERLALGR